MCFVWISEETAIISLHNTDITEAECLLRGTDWVFIYIHIILRSAHTVYLCVLCGYQNKQRLFPYTTLTGLYNRSKECTARYGLGLYI